MKRGDDERKREGEKMEMDGREDVSSFERHMLVLHVI